MKYIESVYRICLTGIVAIGVCFCAILVLFAYAYIRGGLLEAKVNIMPLLSGWGGFLSYFWIVIFVGFIVTWFMHCVMLAKTKVRESKEGKDEGQG